MTLKFGYTKMAVLIIGHINYVNHLEQMIFRFGHPRSHTDGKREREREKKKRKEKPSVVILYHRRTISIPGITPALINHGCH